MSAEARRPSPAGPRAWLREAWWAASAPGAFFEALEERPAVGRASLAGLASVTVAALIAAALIARATGSTALLPIVLGFPAAVLPYVALVTLLGGLILLRAAGLDLRAWEVAAWAWVPAGFLAVALLPIGLLAPAATLIGGLLMLPPWHLWLVHAGTRAHAAGGVRAAVTLYVLVVFIAPAALVLFTLVMLSAGYAQA